MAARTAARRGRCLPARRSGTTTSGLTVCAHGEAFAGTKVDIGTRFLLAFLPQMQPDATGAVDLGCGTGVLACALKRARPAARGAGRRTSPPRRCSPPGRRSRRTASTSTVVRDFGLAPTADASADLVLLNPPFHTGATVHERLAQPLFAEAGPGAAPRRRAVDGVQLPLDHRRRAARRRGPDPSGRAATGPSPSTVSTRLSAGLRSRRPEPQQRSTARAMRCSAPSRSGGGGLGLLGDLLLDGHVRRGLEVVEADAEPVLAAGHAASLRAARDRAPGRLRPPSGQQQPQVGADGVEDRLRSGPGRRPRSSPGARTTSTYAFALGSVPLGRTTTRTPPSRCSCRPSVGGSPSRPVRQVVDRAAPRARRGWPAGRRRPRRPCRPGRPDGPRPGR